MVVMSGVRVQCHRMYSSGTLCGKDATVDYEVVIPLQPTAKSDKWLLASYTVSMCDEHGEEYNTRR